MIPEDQLQLFDSGLDETGKSHLKSMAQWAAITAIASFATIVVMLLQLFKIYSQFGSYGSGENLVQQFITLGCGILINAFLMIASSQIKKALNSEDQGMLNKGLQALKTYFKIYGILLILLIVVVLLAVIYYLMAYNRF